MKKSKKDIISMRDLDKEEILHILKVARELNEEKPTDLLKNKIISTLFFEPSTRTRLSFQSAAQRLGAQVLGFDSPDGTSVKKGETLYDTIKMAESYSDLIVIRHPLDGSARLAGNASKVPVLNAGDGINQHPSQTLLDLYTILEAKGTLNDLKIAFVGDLKYGRTVHSLVKAISYFNPTVYFISPEILKIPEYILNDLEEAGIEYRILDDFRDCLSEIDVFYMTRIQKERFPDENEYEKLRGTYVISKSNILGKCKEDMIILHPLPRVDEISVDLDSTKHALYFKQAQNGVPVRQAMMSIALGIKEKLEG